MSSPTSENVFKPALIVVDMQYDFVYGSLAVPDAPSIIDTVNSVLRLPFITKIGTKDYHPPDHISFASTHHKPVGSIITVYHPGEPEGDAKDGEHGLAQNKERRGEMEQRLWPVHCVASTPGSEFVEGLDQKGLDGVILKGVDSRIESYSAFRDPWHITTTELPQQLSNLGITDVFLVGLAGDYCVKFTALDAVEFGFKTWVVKDAVRSVGNTGEEWEEMSRKGIRIVDSSKVAELVR